MDLLGERRLVGPYAALREAAGSGFENLKGRPETTAVFTRLLYRLGLWSDTIDLARRYVNPRDLPQLEEPDDGLQDQRPRSPESATLWLVRTWATIAGKCAPVFDELVELAIIAKRMSPSISRIDIESFVLLGALTRSSGQEPIDSLRESISACAARIAEVQWRRNPRVLRLAALILDASNPSNLLNSWAASRVQLPREVEVPGLADMFAEILGAPRRKEVRALLSKPSSENFAKVDEIWRMEKPRVLDALDSDAQVRACFRSLAAYDHSDWGRPLGNALTRTLLLNSSPELTSRLDRFGFRATTSQGSFDGIARIDSAIENGQLLGLAKSLANWQGLRRDIQKRAESPYPQDVFEVSEALVRWHATIIKNLLPSRNSGQVSSPASY